MFVFTHQGVDEQLPGVGIGWSSLDGLSEEGLGFGTSALDRELSADSHHGFDIIGMDLNPLAIVLDQAVVVVGCQKYFVDASTHIAIEPAIRIDLLEYGLKVG